MRLPTLLPAVLAATANLASASDATRTAAIYIQPLTGDNPSGTPPSLLAELAFLDQPSIAPTDEATTTPASAEVLSYSAPEDLPDEDSNNHLFRIGIYDPSTQRWTSSTSVTSAANFAKGYAPHFVLSLDDSGDSNTNGDSQILGVACRGVAIDAGVTRDFGPQAVVVRTQRGAQPVLGKPIVLSPEGRKVGEEGEKTFLQKYWWALALGAVLLLSGGGDQK